MASVSKSAAYPVRGQRASGASEVFRYNGRLLMKGHRYQLVLTTCPDTQAAEGIAKTLVGERLAACVNILPLTQSIYLWKGQVESAAEQLLLIKSMVNRYGAIQKRILELHPYELPEVIAVPIAGGFSDYLAWLRNPDKTQ